MNFKKWAKSIQTSGYNGARTVLVLKTGVYKAKQLRSQLVKLMWNKDFVTPFFHKIEEFQSSLQQQTRNVLKKKKH